MPQNTLRIARDTDGRSLPKKVPFRVATLQAVTCPAGKSRTWIYDSRQAALALLVTPNSKAFYVYKWAKGKPVRLRLGAFGEITIEQARKLAVQQLGKLAQGIDPQQERREARARGLTIGDLWEFFFEHHAKLRKRSWRQDQIRYEKWIKPSWSARRISDLTRADVSALHRRVAEKTSDANANRVLALLRVLFNRGREIGVEFNPCAGIPQFPEHSRERFLDGAELGRLFVALGQQPKDWRDFFQLALFTGARRQNLLSAEWSEIDFATSTWVVPSSKFKNGKAAAVVLNASAVEILASRKDNGSKYVFPSNRRDGHLIKPEHRWEAICKTANLVGVRVHDLRRTFGSLQAQGGSSLLTIGQSLGHRSSSSTLIYSRFGKALDGVRASVNGVKAALLAAKGEANA
jgi:integrase